MKHSFPEESKQKYRDDLILFLKTRAGKSLLNNDKLIGSWCELSGNTGNLTLESLVKENLILESQFIGVDFDREILTNFAKQYPKSKWISGSLLEVIHDFDDISVLNFDSYRATGSMELMRDLDGVRPIIANSIRKFGAFCLFLNTDLDATRTNKIKPSDALMGHVESVCRILNGWLPGHGLNVNNFVHDFTPLDNGFTGSIGDFYIYRSKKHRMVNMKVLFR